MHADYQSIDHALKSWWANARDTGGLRLSDPGYAAFLQIPEYKRFEFEIDRPILNGKNLLALDRYLSCPYHIRSAKRTYLTLTLFGSAEAMMATLYGDIAQWLQRLQQP